MQNAKWEGIFKTICDSLVLKCDTQSPGKEGHLLMAIQFLGV